MSTEAKQKFFPMFLMSISKNNIRDYISGKNKHLKLDVSCTPVKYWIRSAWHHGTGEKLCDIQVYDSFQKAFRVFLVKNKQTSAFEGLRPVLKVSGWCEGYYRGTGLKWDVVRRVHDGKPVLGV